MFYVSKYNLKKLVSELLKCIDAHCTNVNYSKKIVSYKYIIDVILNLVYIILCPNCTNYLMLINQY